MTMQEKFHILLHNKIKNRMLLNLNDLVYDIENTDNVNIIKETWNKCKSEWESIVEYESDIIKDLCRGIKIKDIFWNDIIIAMISREEYYWIWNIIKEIREDAIKIKKQKKRIKIEISNGNKIIRKIGDAIDECKNKGILKSHIEEMIIICNKHIKIFHEMDEGIQMI